MGYRATMRYSVEGEKGARQTCPTGTIRQSVRVADGVMEGVVDGFHGFGGIRNSVDDG